jgi:hypothetical protein
MEKKLSKTDQAEVDAFLSHPLNSGKFDVEDPLVQGLQTLVQEGDPDQGALSLLVGLREP